MSSTRVAAALAAVLIWADPTSAQDPAATGRITGRVMRPDNQPAADAEVTVVGTRLRRRVDAQGAFAFDGVPPGEQILQAESRRYGISAGHVTVAAGATVEIELTLDAAQHHEEVVVTASATGQTAGELAQPASVLSGSELALRQRATLGETLSQTPGVSSTYFGPGASRPVIRGLGGERVRVLQGGLGVADASGTSPDHAVAADPLSARQIEVLRGPATLLYGSSAIGGVVNVVDARVPDRVPHARVTGVAIMDGASAAQEFAIGASVDGGFGRFAWHVDAQHRASEDVSIPGFAESAVLRASEGEEGEDHEQVEGFLPNSAVENLSLGLGASWVGDKGYLGVAVSGFDSLYGVPGHEHHGEEEEEEEESAAEEEGVRIDMQQRRVELRGERTAPMPGFESGRLRVAWSDYDHTEIEDGEIGTVFTNRSWEGRAEGRHRNVGAFVGSFGVQAGRRDFRAEGDEAFVPPSTTDSLAAFLFEEARRGPWRFQLGGRVEKQDVETDTMAREFTSVSGSLGLIWEKDENGSIGISVARSVRAPTAEELFSNGPHLATGLYELGDPDLRREKSLGVDVSLRRREGFVTGELNLFWNRFGDFIYEMLADDEVDGLPVAQFVQDDATFRGGELSLRVDALHREPRHLDIELSADVVRADLVESGQPLPRIPPFRYGAGLHYHDDAWDARVELRGSAEQDRTGPRELPTDAHAMVNASVSRRFFIGTRILDLALRGTNLNDVDARTHVSFLKDIVPLPGRDIRLVAQLRF